MGALRELIPSRRDVRGTKGLNKRFKQDLHNRVPAIHILTKFPGSHRSPLLLHIMSIRHTRTTRPMVSGFGFGFCNAIRHSGVVAGGAEPGVELVEHDHAEAGDPTSMMSSSQNPKALALFSIDTTLSKTVCGTGIQTFPVGWWFASCVLASLAGPVLDVLGCACCCG
eukprot:2429813-Amphidinium_carterae.3